MTKWEEIQPKIRELLNKTKQEWEDCLKLDEKEREGKHFILFLLWKDSKKEARAKEILTLIDNTKLETLDAAPDLMALAAVPHNRLEKLKGKRKGQRSIRVNKQYRICFTWSKDNHAYEVEIVDYHDE